MEIKPLGERVVVQMTESERVTNSGIVIPDSAKEKPQFAKIVAVGPGTSEVKMEVEVGQTVIISKYAGTEVKLEKEEYIILKQSDILAVVQ